MYIGKLKLIFLFFLSFYIDSSENNYANEFLIWLIDRYFKQIKCPFFIKIKLLIWQVSFFYILGDSRSCAASVIRLQMTNLVYLVLLSSILSRRTASESQVTWSLFIFCIYIHYTCQYTSSVHQCSRFFIIEKKNESQLNRNMNEIYEFILWMKSQDCIFSSSSSSSSSSYL